MLEGKFEPMRLRVLVVDDELRDDTAEGRASRALVTDLRERNLDVVEAHVGGHVRFGDPRRDDGLDAR
jgi:hypothetical protein